MTTDLAAEAPPPSNRSHRRYQRAATAAVAGVAAKFLSIAATAVGITLISRNYDAETLGVWVLLISTVSLLGFADLGLGNGVLNVVAAASGRDDVSLARRAISSAFVILIALAVVLGAVFAATYRSVPWTSALSAGELPPAELANAIAWFVICALVALPLAAAQRAQLALQEGWIVQLWNSLGSIASIVAIVWAVEAQQPLPILVLAGLVGAPIACLGNSISLYFVQHPELRPSLRAADRISAALVLRQGGFFFVIAVLYAFAFQTDSILISHFLGADAVPTYAVPARIFGLLPMMLALVLNPLWPAHAESLERGDYTWARLALRRSLKVSVLAVPVTVLLALLTPLLASIWLGRTLDVPVGLTACLAWWTITVSICTPLSMFLNGARVIRAQLVMSVIMTVVNFALSIVLVQAVGITGPVFATALSQTVFILVPSLILVRPMLRSTTREDAVHWLARWSATVDRDEATTSSQQPT